MDIHAFLKKKLTLAILKRISKRGGGLTSIPWKYNKEERKGFRGYQVQFHKDGKKRTYSLLRIEPNGTIHVRYYYHPVTSHFTNIEISYDKLEPYDLKIIQHFDHKEISHTNMLLFYFFSTIRWYSVKFYIIGFFENISQFFFNRKSLATLKRMDLLKRILDYYEETELDELGLDDLMTKIYSSKWDQHPHAQTRKKMIKFYLRSFEHSGELAGVGHYQFQIQPKAIDTYEKYEELKNRDVIYQRLQLWMIVLTSVLAITSVINLFE